MPKKKDNSNSGPRKVGRPRKERPALEVVQDPMLRKDGQPKRKPGPKKTGHKGKTIGCYAPTELAEAIDALLESLRESHPGLVLSNVLAQAAILGLPFLIREHKESLQRTGNVPQIDATELAKGILVKTHASYVDAVFLPVAGAKATPADLMAAMSKGGK